MKLVYHTIFPFGFLFLFIIIFFLRLFYPESSLFMIPDFGESDVLHLNLPLKITLSASLKSHQWPLWTSLIGNGFPLLAEGQIGTFYLPNLIMFRFFDPIFAYNTNLVISYVIAAFGMYLFSKKLGMSRIISTYISFLFTFSGFLAVHLNHFNLIQASSLTPLLFWIAVCLWKTPSGRYSILFALILSQQIFTGHFYIVFISLTGVGLFWLFLFLFHLYPNKISIRYILRRFSALVIVMVLSFGLSAIQLLPTIELWGNSVRRSGLDFDTVTSFAYPYKHILTFFNPYALGSPADGSYKAVTSEWIIFWENTGYIGLIPILLAIASLFFIKRTKIKIFLSLSIISFLLVLGRNSPLYFIFSIPPFNFFRVPSKFLLLTTISLATLSGLTLDATIRKIQQSIKNQTIIYKIALVCILILWAGSIVDLYRFSYSYPPISPSSPWLEKPESYSYVADTKNRILTIAAPAAWNDIFLKRGWQDMQPFIYFRNSLYPNYNMLFDIKQVDYNTGGIVPSRLSYMNNFIKKVDLDDDHKIASLDGISYTIASLMSVEYLISAFPLTDPQLALAHVINPSDDDLNPFFIYQNKIFRGRAYTSYMTLLVNTVEQFHKSLSRSNFLSDQSVLIEDNALLLPSQIQNISFHEIYSDTNNEVVIATNNNREGILVLTDTYYPGWMATIDDKKTEIYRVNIFQKGIRLPEGSHIIRFSYHSASFEYGKLITIVTAIIIASGVFLVCVASAHRVSGSGKLFPYLSSKPHNLMH